MLRFILDLFFPPTCVHCGSVGGYICPTCSLQIQFFEESIHTTAPHSQLDALYATTPFQGIGQKFVHTLKFGGVSDCAQTMARMMIHSVPINDLKDADFISYIPLHPKRERVRGFNQAQLLAKHLSKYWGIPVEQTIKKSKSTSPQAELNRKERLTHLKNAFEIIDNNKLKGRTVLLIDDVSTTGSTLSEAAKVLKKAKVKKIIGVVFAHDEIPKNAFAKT